MSYSEPLTCVYSYGMHDFGAASETFTFKGPAGKKGYIVDVNVSAVEAFADGTGAVKIGSAEGGAQYVNMVLGTLADKANLSASADSTDFVLRDLPADTNVWVQFLQPAAGSQTGQAFVQIIVNWY